MTNHTNLKNALAQLKPEEVDGAIIASLCEWSGDDFKLWTGEYDDEDATFIAESDIPLEGDELDEELVINKRQMNAVLHLSDRLIEVIRLGLKEVK